MARSVNGNGACEARAQIKHPERNAKVLQVSRLEAAPEALEREAPR